MRNLDEVYDSIVDNIIEGQCAFILGPELSVQDVVGYKSFFKRLVNENGQDISHYFPSENLFSFTDSAGELRIRKKVKDFYGNVGDPPLLEMISRIKLPLILNVCPDKALLKYEDKETPYQSAYFSLVSSPSANNIPYPSKEKPILYNVFGSIENEQTLILTHGKLYKVIEGLMPKNSLPDNIESFLESCNSFILLGFDFDSWYYQLICHKLKVRIPDTHRTSLSTRNNYEHTNMMSVVMDKHFEVQFTSENSSQVIQKIITKLETKKPSELRTKKATDHYSLFFSYAWKDENATGITRESIVDLIALDIEKKKEKNGKLQVVRDKNNMTFGDSINSFMTRIGTGKTVIIVLSDKYLKSRYCMDEAIRIYNYEDKEKRIFTVLFDDIVFDKPTIKKYKSYWEKECLSALNNGEDILSGHYDIYVRIYRFIEDFLLKCEDVLHLKLDENDLILNQQGIIKLSAAKEVKYQSFIDTVLDKIKE